MRFPKLTIRQRLPLYISLSALLILLLEGYIIYAFSVRYYEYEFKRLLEARLEQADSLIARDRNHPQNAIEADLALQQTRSAAYYQQALENVREQAQNLNEMVAKLLLMAKVESNNKIAETPSAVDEALMAAFDLLHQKYPKAKQKVRLHMDAPLEAPFVVCCDPDILKMACFNLLDNALKYGQEEVVSVRLSLRNDWICLEVEDQGAGIEASEMEHLFKPFYRSKKNSHLPGSGVGLSLVKTIAEKCKGSLTLDSEPGKGTTACLLLPIYYGDPT